MSTPTSENSDNRSGNLLKILSPNSFQQEPLDAAGLVWFNNLKNQYLTLSSAQKNATEVHQKACAAIDLVVAKEAPALGAQDVFDLEDLLLVLLSGPVLAARLRALRDEYQDVFGKEAWEKIQPTLLAQVDPAKDEENRAESRRLQEELHWQASIRPWASQLRQTMMAAVLVILGLAMFALAVNAHRRGPEMAGTVMLLGVIGGAVSSIQRIQSANLASSRALMLARYSMLKLGVVISPVLGGVFALLMALFLMAKTVTPGLVVPDITVECSTNFFSQVKPAVVTNTVTFPLKVSGNTNSALAFSLPVTNELIALTSSPTINTDSAVSTTVKKSTTSAVIGKMEPTKTGPTMPCRYLFFTLTVVFASGKELALFLLWAFAAGFSERLVPDLLTKLADPKKP